MSNLIKALQILLQYSDPKYPTNCSHDILIICGIDPQIVSDEHKQELKNLGFDHDDQCFYSYRYGSA